MSNLDRRDAVKWAAGLAIGSGIAATPHLVAADDTNTPPVAAPTDQDEWLVQVRSDVQRVQLGKPVTLQLAQGGRGHDLVITSARDENGKAVKYRVRLSSVRIIRADRTVDAFTRAGGLYWTHNGQSGQVQLDTPGAVVMIVREHDETVRFYTALPDFRC